MERKQRRQERNTYLCRYCKVYVRACRKIRHNDSLKHLKHRDQYYNHKINSIGTILYFY